jgi:hypothetical protein
LVEAVSMLSAITPLSPSNSRSPSLILSWGMGLIDLPTKSAQEGHCLTQRLVIDEFPERYSWSDAKSSNDPRKLSFPHLLTCE